MIQKINQPRIKWSILQDLKLYSFQVEDILWKIFGQVKLKFGQMNIFVQMDK
jgi:hypothetical protein